MLNPDRWNRIEPQELSGGYPTVARDDCVFSSTSTGLVKPKTLMLSAIWRTWCLEWVRALRGNGINCAKGRYSTLSSEERCEDMEVPFLIETFG